MKNTEPKLVEKEKLVAEKLNGRFAMLGFIALVGAYLTTGQIIPGFIQINIKTCLKNLVKKITRFFFFNYKFYIWILSCKKGVKNDYKTLSQQLE